MEKVFEAASENTLEKLLEFYRAHFEVTREEEVDGIIVPVLAQMHHREAKNFLGMKSSNRLGPQANEYVFFLTERIFDENVFLKASSLLSFAMRELVNPSSIHGYTFLSAVVICESIDEKTAKKIKRYKSRVTFGQNGWATSRIIAFKTGGGFLSNGDGAGLGKMLLGIMKGER